MAQSVAPESAVAPAPTLEDMVGSAGLRLASEVSAIMSLAASAQTRRLADGSSDRSQVTRSTALWALSTVDHELRTVLAPAGVRPDALATMLRLVGVPEPMSTAPAGLEEELADAVRSYLPSLPRGTEVRPADLATAILRSASSSDRGVLPGRLARLDVDYHAALSALEGLRASPAFSATVRKARASMGTDTPVTAAAIAAAIQQDHREYAGGRFGALTLRQSLGRRQNVDQWLEKVAALYDTAAVAASRHRVLNGELFILGLAELEPSLAEDLRAGGALEALRDSVAVLPSRATDRTAWSSDAPAVIDLLGRSQAARVLAGRLRNLPPGVDFLVHIDGAWGSGKSSLFNFLEAELRHDSLLVHVNAWREQQVGVGWWTLYNALRSAVEAEATAGAGPGRVSRVVALLRAKARSRLDVIRIRLVPFVVAVLVLGAVLMALFLLADFDLGVGAQLADSVAKVTTLGLLALGGVTAAYRFLIPESRRSAQAFVSSSPNPMAEVQLLFQRTLQRADRRVVFLVDDLDRCDGPYIVEFLSTMLTLLRRDWHDAPRAASPRPASCAFVAADGQWVRSSYESHYASVRASDVPGRPLGYLFLEKIFQLQVRLPSIGAEGRSTFYESLLMPAAGPTEPSVQEQQTVARIEDQVRRATTGPEIVRAAQAAEAIADPAQRMGVRGDAAVRFSELSIQDQTHHELAPYARFLEPNPRSIRLFVNTYGTLQSFRTLEGIPTTTSALARWTVLEIRWPQLADHLRARPEDVEPAGRQALPGVIKTLLDNPEVQEVLTGLEGEDLTADDVRRCTGAASPR